MPPRKDLRDHTRMVTRRLVLFVGHILLLVEDDCTDISGRCKECRTRTEDNARIPAPYAKDRIVALGE